MIRRFAHIVLLFFLFSSVFSQRITVSGYITDAQTGEKIIGATIVCNDNINYTFTNSYGYYNMGLRSGNDIITLQASYVGYMPLKIDIIPDKDLKIDFKLESRNILDEVIITAESPVTYEKRKEMSIASVPVARISVLPALGGESDMLKSIQLMPGVQTGNEASSNLYVRGGSPDQNLMVIDDVPIYYVNHLGGFISTFNTDAINSMKLVKGGFPARYGSRLSSVLDVKMKEGNMKEFHGNGMIGMLASKIMVEGPIKKDTTSYMLSVRRFMYDLITRPLTRATSFNGTSVGYNFYDLNAKINHIISSKDRIYLSFYSGDDAVLTRYRSQGDVNKTTLRWGNILGSFRWNHLYGERLFSNLTLYSTRYNMGYEYEYIMNYGDRKEKSRSTYTSGIIDISAKLDYEYFINQNYRLKFGGKSIYHFFNPNRINYSSSGTGAEADTTFGSVKTKGFENAIYLENDITAGRRFFTNIGLRVSNYSTSQKNYLHYEPRILSSLMISDKTFLKASWSVMNQYIHLLTGSGPTMQSDIWVPVTDKIPPSYSQQYALGIEKTFGKKDYNVSVEGYYKTMNSLITYKEGVALLSSSSDWQSQVETGGKGKSYGIEFLLQKNAGKATGWIAYTYSKNTRQFEDKNFGKPFPYKYDRTHDISIVYLQKIKENIQFSASWVYGTGNPFTLSAGKYLMSTGPGDDLNISTAYYNYGQIYNELNSFRMRAYHKLDIGINFHKSVRWGERTWSINVYNVYNRQNPYFYFLDTTAEFAPNGSEIPGSGKTVLKQQSYFPIIPSFSYSLKF
jgi:hypothetical protein